MKDVDAMKPIDMPSKREWAFILTIGLPVVLLVIIIQGMTSLVSPIVNLVKRKK